MRILLLLGTIVLQLWMSAFGNRKVVLLGDSLIEYPYNENNLTNRIDSYLKTNESFIYIDAGVGGNKIADIKHRVRSVMNENNVTMNDYVILYWDSDCSGVDESTKSQKEVNIIRERYQYNVQAVIDDILAFTSYLSIAGPELLGEGPVDDPSISCGKWYNKVSMLNDYRTMNRNITESNKLEYVDIRQAYLDKIPQGWTNCYGALTRDGEHPNDAGSDIEAQLFANQIDTWALLS